MLHLYQTHLTWNYQSRKQSRFYESNKVDRFPLKYVDTLSVRQFDKSAGKERGEGFGGESCPLFQGAHFVQSCPLTFLDP